MYRKINALAACVSVFLIVLMLSTTRVSAQYAVGVEAGDWAGYGDMFFEYASNMTGYEDPPPGMDMSWMDMGILDVHNGNVTVRSTTIYANGTEETDVIWGNITSGEGDLSVGIIPSNLGTGDEIPANLTWFTEEPLTLTINGTITKSCAGANREVNYVNITSPIIYDNVTYGFMNMSFCWDKKTGVLCEEWYSYEMGYTVNTTYYYYNMLMLWRMTTTNMWPAVFPVNWNGYEFNVTMMSNSTTSDFSFSQVDKEISFDVTGPAGKAGYCNVTIPKDLLRDSPWTIMLNGTDWTTFCTITENATHAFIYIPYTHSTNTIQIVGTGVIPEFTSYLILPLFIVATLLATILLKKRKHFLVQTGRGE